MIGRGSGRVGERYLISEKMIGNAAVARIAAEAAGVPAPAKSLPLPVAYAMATLGSLKAPSKGTDERLSLDSLRLTRAEADATKPPVARDRRFGRGLGAGQRHRTDRLGT